MDGQKKKPWVCIEESYMKSFEEGMVEKKGKGHKLAEKLNFSMLKYF